MRQLLSETEMIIVLNEEIARLDNLTRPTWKRVRTPLKRLPTSQGSEVWSVSRAGDEVIIYDHVSENFATARLNEAGVVGEWTSYGPAMRDALRHFPKES